MPLVRNDDRYRFEAFEGVYFLMTDGATNVLCKVSHEALRDRSLQDGDAASLSDTFIRHRQCIEMIADRKYAQGHAPNDLILVLSGELTPLPE